MMMFFYELLMSLFGWHQRAPPPGPAAAQPLSTSHHANQTVVSSFVTTPSTTCLLPCPSPTPRGPVARHHDNRSKFSSSLIFATPSRRVVNVAVTGPLASGKTTLVRAMVGLDPAGDEGGQESPASRPAVAKSHVFPANHLVQIWDLPGVPDGMEDNDLGPYDFFILTASARASEEVRRLAREILKMDKEFIFVRTKLDVYVRETQQENFGVDNLLREVHKYYVKVLQAEGVQNPRVYLLSTILPDAYEFQEFMDSFTREFPPATHS